MSMRKFDLKQLRNHFYEIGEKIWGQTLQLEDLKKVFVSVRNNKEELSLKHLMAVRDDYAFGNWWKMPEISEDDFLPLKGIFTEIRPHDEEVIGKLLNLLGNIEIVSCVLRLADPQNYGIMSPPVENILNVRGKNATEKYLNYLRNLEELKDEYNFVRIADVDMALWTLANILNYSNLRHNTIYSDIYEAYEQTANPVKKIMARNSLEQIEKETPLYKAELFLESDYVLAGIIAGRELELFVKNLCKKNDIKLTERTKKRNIRYLRIHELAEKLSNKKVITKGEKDNIEKWWETRCKLTHEDEKPLPKEDVMEMINGIKDQKLKYINI